MFYLAPGTLDPMDRQQHGSLYDRGRADSYYNRSPSPHYGGTGGASWRRTEVSHPRLVDEYMAGYDENEAEGNKRTWDDGDDR